MKMIPSSPSFVICSSDNVFALNLVFEAIDLQTIVPGEVLVIDDGSDQEIGRVISAWTSLLRCRLTCIREVSGQFRRAAALNRAIGGARGDYLIFLEGDCLPHRRFVQDHLRNAEAGVFVQGRRAGIRARYVRGVRPRHFQPLLWLVCRRVYDLRRGLRRPWPVVRLDAASFVDGCNFAAWRSDLVQINGFDESFVGWGHEAAELSERLRNAGVHSKTVIGQAIAYHLDHRPVARYRTGVNERILARTRLEKRTRCEHGLAQSVSATASA